MVAWFTSEWREIFESDVLENLFIIVAFYSINLRRRQDTEQIWQMKEDLDEGELIFAILDENRDHFIAFRFGSRLRHWITSRLG